MGTFTTNSSADEQKTYNDNEAIKVGNCYTVKIKGEKYKVVTISANALKGNKKVMKVTIGKGVTKIGKKAFYKCSKLKSVSVKSKKLKSVGKYAFKGIAKKASIRCPSKQLKKYKKLITKSKIGSEVKITK